MKRILLSLGLGVCIFQYVQAQDITETSLQSTELIMDTLYYDRLWKGVEIPTFATFYRVIQTNASDGYRKPFRDYYMTGGLQREGYYITIDRYDDSKSVMDGEIISYYRSGKAERVTNYTEGVLDGEFVEYYEDGTKQKAGKYAKGELDGEYVEYYEDGVTKKKETYTKGVLDGEYAEYYMDGLVHTHEYYRNGHLNGIQTIFFSDDQLGNACMQMEFRNGTLLENYMIVSNQNGLYSKVRLDDNSIIYESPSLDDKMVEYIDGVAWHYYNYNGIMIGMTTSAVKDHGKYYRASFIVTNNTICPFDFDPTLITATLFDKKDKAEPLDVYTAEEYMKKVKRSNMRKIFAWGLVGALAVAASGYSKSTTETSESGYVSSAGSASAFGSGGYAFGSYSSDTYYGGKSKTTTTSYNGAAAYQAAVIESDRLAAYSNALLSEQAAKEAGYLKINTLYPGQSIKGYINIDKKKGANLVIDVDINGAVFSFPWELKN